MIYAERHRFGFVRVTDGVSEHTYDLNFPREAFPRKGRSYLPEFFPNRAALSGEQLMRERFDSLCSNEPKISPIGEDQTWFVQSNRPLSNIGSIEKDQVVACPWHPGRCTET